MELESIYKTMPIEFGQDIARAVYEFQQLDNISDSDIVRYTSLILTIYSKHLNLISDIKQKES